MIGLIKLLIVGAYGDSKIAGQNFELSFCEFSNDSQLRYFCQDQQDNQASSNELNTLEVVQHLRGRYDIRKRPSFKNISLLFFKFQRSGLCVASSPKNVSTLKQVFIKLPVDGINYQHFLVCIKRHSRLERNYTFSCATNVDKMAELPLTVSGYDVAVGSTWTTMLKIDIVHNCSSIVDTPDQDHHKDLPLLVAIIIWVVLAVIAVGSIISSVIFVKCYNAHMKHAMSRRLYAYTLLLNKLSAGNSIILDSDSKGSDISQLYTVATVSDSQQTSTASGTDSHTSVHHQDDSSEDRSISPLPKTRVLWVESWMESSM